MIQLSSHLWIDSSGYVIRQGSEDSPVKISYGHIAGVDSIEVKNAWKEWLRK